MTESQLNHMIDESFKQHGYSYKIPDAPRKNAASRPFDGFAVIPEGNIFWETKLIKAYRAFPFSMILQHQIDALTEIDAVEAYNETIPLIILGIYISNARADLFFFRHRLYSEIQRSGRRGDVKRGP